MTRAFTCHQRCRRACTVCPWIKLVVAPATQQNLTLLVNQDTTQDFIYALDQRASVTVEASAANIETGNATWAASSSRSR